MATPWQQMNWLSVCQQSLALRKSATPHMRKEEVRKLHGLAAGGLPTNTATVKVTLPTDGGSSCEPPPRLCAAERCLPSLPLKQGPASSDIRENTTFSEQLLHTISRFFLQDKLLLLQHLLRQHIIFMSALLRSLTLLHLLLSSNYRLFL